MSESNEKEQAPKVQDKQLSHLAEKEMESVSGGAAFVRSVSGGGGETIGTLPRLNY